MDPVERLNLFNKRREKLDALLADFKSQKTVETGQAVLHEIIDINQEFPNAFTPDTLEKMKKAIKALEKERQEKNYH